MEKSSDPSHLHAAWAGHSSHPQGYEAFVKWLARLHAWLGETVESLDGFHVREWYMYIFIYIIYYYIIYVYCPAFMIVEKVVLYIFVSFDPTVTPPTGTTSLELELGPFERALAVGIGTLRTLATGGE